MNVNDATFALEIIDDGLRGRRHMHSVCTSLCFLKYELEDVSPELEKHVLTLVGIDSELDDVPPDHAAHLWARDALAQAYASRDAYIARRQPDIVEALLALRHYLHEWLRAHRKGGQLGDV